MNFLAQSNFKRQMLAYSRPLLPIQIWTRLWETLKCFQSPKRTLTSTSSIRRCQSTRSRGSIPRCRQRALRLNKSLFGKRMTYRCSKIGLPCCRPSLNRWGSPWWILSISRKRRITRLADWIITWSKQGLLILWVRCCQILKSRTKLKTTFCLRMQSCRRKTFNWGKRWRRYLKAMIRKSPN